MNGDGREEHLVEVHPFQGTPGMACRACERDERHPVHLTDPVARAAVLAASRPDVRVPYHPAEEVFRLEMVMTTDGKVSLSIPPNEMLFWMLLEQLRDEAKAYFRKFKKVSPLAL